MQDEKRQSGAEQLHSVFTCVWMCVCARAQTYVYINITCTHRENIPEQVHELRILDTAGK